MLTDSTIEQEMKRKNIVISPFNPQNLKNTMYDITLGEYYFVPKKGNQTFLNPYSKKSIKDYYEQTPKKARLVSDFSEIKDDLLDSGYSLDDRIILVPRRTIILCHTNEFIGGRKNITTSLCTRSTIARSGGLRLCSCAGMGDVNFVNRWALEVENPSEKCIALIVGKTIGSIIFHRVEGDVKDDYSTRGKYCKINVDEIVKDKSEDEIFEGFLNVWDTMTLLPVGECE